VIFSPICHPEVAGRGIEYCWGKGKLDFRRLINTEEPKDVEKNTRTALSSERYIDRFGKEQPAPLPLERVRRFARRARTYRRLYQRWPTPAAFHAAAEEANKGEYAMVEHHYAERKAHRNIVDSELKFLEQDGAPPAIEAGTGSAAAAAGTEQGVT